MYHIYKHTFKSNGKIYIGMTSIGIFNRLHKHWLNALAGMDTKFYRCIRKYGIEDITTECLAEIISFEEAKQLEQKYILEYDTFKTGLNMTHGGDGGSICNNLPPEKYEAWIKKQTTNSTGENNARYCGKTDDEIILVAIEYMKKTKRMVRKQWFEYSSNINLPKYYSKFRFSGNGFNGFLEKLKQKMKELGINPDEYEWGYTKTAEHKCKLGASHRGKPLSEEHKSKIKLSLLKNQNDNH